MGKTIAGEGVNSRTCTIIVMQQILLDHMVGLDSLIPTLKRRNAVKVNHRIYCSAISKTFLVKKFNRVDERYITALSPNDPVVLNIFDKGKKDMYKLKVTTIPAQHCPGSVM